MALIDNLVAAMLRHQGEALVLHVGERPYVVTPEGNVELSARELTPEAIVPMLEQLLSGASQTELEEFGAVQTEIRSAAAGSDERFLLVAARGGEDIWIELRRKPGPEPLLMAQAAPADDAVAEPARTPEPAQPPPVDTPDAPGGPAVVVPMRPVERPPDRPAERAARAGGGEASDLERLLRIAASRRATTLYVVTDTRPSLRIEGEVRPLDTEPVLAAADVEALVLAMQPEDDREALRRGTEADWVRDLPEIGRVRCTRFRDHRGPGAICQLIGGRPATADELDLPRGVRDLADEHEGIVLVTGPRVSGKSTLLAALVDLINRTRSAHVITLEAQITVVHQNRMSIVSQREVRGDPEALVAMARTALREGPDVLAIEDLRSRDVVALAIQAAESGVLVLGTLAAPNAAGAIERVIDQGGEERRPSIRRALADTLRGVVAQVLLRKIGGGRVAARELLRNTPPVANLIAEGNLSRVAAAFEHGRRAGMISLNESLLELVRREVVNVQEAYRQAADRDALVKLLERDGFDTSFVERMA